MQAEVKFGLILTVIFLELRCDVLSSLNSSISRKSPYHREVQHNVTSSFGLQDKSLLNLTSNYDEDTFRVSLRNKRKTKMKRARNRKRKRRRKMKQRKKKYSCIYSSCFKNKLNNTSSSKTINKSPQIQISSIRGDNKLLNIKSNIDLNNGNTSAFESRSTLFPNQFDKMNLLDLFNPINSQNNSNIFEVNSKYYNKDFRDLFKDTLPIIPVAPSTYNSNRYFGRRNWMNGLPRGNGQSFPREKIGGRNKRRYFKDIFGSTNDRQPRKFPSNSVNSIFPDATFPEIDAKPFPSFVRRKTTIKPPLLPPLTPVFIGKRKTISNSPFEYEIINQDRFHDRKPVVSSKDWEFISEDNLKTRVESSKGSKEEDETAFEIDISQTIPEENDVDVNFKNCLKCPVRREVEDEKIMDWIPLFIPKPKKICQKYSLKYQVEISPKADHLGYQSREGRYYINLSILEGKNNSTLKTCVYNYQVQVKECPELPILTNGKVNCSAGRSWGSLCRWKCMAGRTPAGATETKCGGSEDIPEWTNPPPKCEIPKCPDPHTLEGISAACKRPYVYGNRYFNSVKKDDYPVGSYCKVKCRLGYYSPSNLYSRNLISSKCLPSGKWSKDIENRCKKIAHSTIPPPVFRDCSDITVYFKDRHIYLTSPKYSSINGRPSYVYCDINSVSSLGKHCRICRARDEVRKLTAACRQCITVLTKEECSPIKAPSNGELRCSEKPNGDMFCSISCKNGFMMPPSFSSGNIHCKEGQRLWNFQKYSNDLLPACVLR